MFGPISLPLSPSRYDVQNLCTAPQYCQCIRVIPSQCMTFGTLFLTLIKTYKIHILNLNSDIIFRHIIARYDVKFMYLHT